MKIIVENDGEPDIRWKLDEGLRIGEVLWALDAMSEFVQTNYGNLSNTGGVGETKKDDTGT